jgi:metal-responsive CopG/Arc/MetJ family transcriptional regulator
MKTAVSIPDNVFDDAERLAKRLGISRSRFYTMAIQNALAQDPRRGVKEKLDAVYSKTSSRIDRRLARAQEVSLHLEDENW